MIMEAKETMIYIIIAAVIVIAVALAVGNSLLSNKYNVAVRLSTVGPSAVYPYQESHFLINVTNNGNNKINSVLLGFYLNGAAISTNTVSIPAHQSIILLRNYTYSESGNYSFQAVADPGRLLNIANRSMAQNTFNYDIMQPQLADVYSSIPNANIINTEQFTLSGLGEYSSSAVANRYNISTFNYLFSNSQNIILKIFDSMASSIAYSKGAYAQYANGSTAYVAWLQGTVSPTEINPLISSFGSKTSLQHNITYSQLNGTSSICTWYSNGWTKLIYYYNASKGSGCAGLASTSFNSTEGVLLANALISNTSITNYQSNFYYTNTTQLGSIISYSRNSLTATRIFNNTLGLFATSIAQVPKGLNVTLSNNTCYGLIYNNNSVHICSVIVPTRNFSVNFPFELVKTTEIQPNYIISEYSLLNSSLVTIAHANAARLIYLLTQNSTTAQWVTGFRSSCSMISPQFGCNFISFNYSSNLASINFTNKLGSSITISKINCAIAAGYPNATINQTIAQNGTAELSFQCHNIPVPETAAISTYTLNITYVSKGITNSTSTYGLLNITNQGLSQYT